MTANLTFTLLSTLIHGSGELDDIIDLEKGSILLFSHIEIDDTSSISDLTLKVVLLFGLSSRITFLGLLRLSFNIKTDNLTNESLVVVPLFKLGDGNRFSDNRLSDVILLAVIAVIGLILSVIFLFALFRVKVNLENIDDIALFSFIIISSIREVVAGESSDITSSFLDARSVIESTN